MKLALKSIIVLFGFMLIVGSTHIEDYLPQIPLKEFFLYSIGLALIIIGVFNLKTRSLK